MSLNPLWEPTNLTAFSSVFTVPPSQVCVLYAADLQKEKYRMDASEFKVPQVMCIRRVLHDFKESIDPNCCPCGWIYDITGLAATKVVDQVVTTCGKPWQLSMCRNIGIIGVPGSYRLELNDATAIGRAQAYADLIPVDMVPSQIKDLFFL